ncbi:MAG TPA: hypothetical protein VHG51_07525, partial [Longimicrobiaceae bacterium]|nr:hypothetical protein [Longimicrobiaceae bacterium]
VAATQVADGLELFRRFKTNDLPWGEEGLPPVEAGEDSDYALLVGALRSLEYAVDAVGDALLAESVHHAVQGNPLRSAAVMDATSWAEAPPPELEFVRTPRTGVGLTHRLVLAGGIPGPDDDLPGWSMLGAWQARGRYEPALNALAARLLPVPNTVHCRVSWVAEDAPPYLDFIPLSALLLSPLDLLALAEDGEIEGSELWLRFVEAARDNPPGDVDREIGWIDFEADQSWGADRLSVKEMLEVARAVRELFLGARPLSEADLAAPEDEPPAAVGDELAGRVSAAVTELEGLLAELVPGDPASWVPMRKVAGFGVPGAFTLERPGADQVRAVADEVTRRLAEVERMNDAFHRAEASAAVRRAHDASALQVLFGGGFRAVAPLVAAPRPELAAALADSLFLQDGDPLAAETWLQRASRVRAGAGRLHTARTYAEAIRFGGAAPLRVAQLPYPAAERGQVRWLGLEGDANATGTRLSLVVDGPVDPQAPLAGLVVDEWVEVVPGAEETTGLAVHFDAPNARPPQAILIAVPADGAAQWTGDALLETLEEALDLALVRAVDPDSITEVGQFLPAAYFSLNVDGQAPSTDFLPLARS